MRMKKGILTICTIAVVILGVFFTIRFIGGKEDSASKKLTDEKTVQNDNLTVKEDKEVVTKNNEVEEYDISSSEVQQDNIKNTEEKYTNEMDSTYINDKTDVGLYTVRKDDTVFSIARTYMPSHSKAQVVEFIKERNSINDSYKITEGQELVIPYEKSVEPAKGEVAESNTIEYVIKGKDTLTSIAVNMMPSHKVEEAIKMIKETNKIENENDIKAGDCINIPKE